MIIEKTAKEINSYLTPLYFFDCARDALKQVLTQYKQKEEYTLFIPGYIGISPNEGSGIFDPICEVNVPYIFYPVDTKLQVDYIKLEKQLKGTQNKKIVLIVHYFGYTDSNYEKIIKICRDNSAIIIEDAAHALYSDFIDHACGSCGDYVIYSLHKMLPFSKGGMLKVNNVDENLYFKTCSYDKYPIFDYDLKGIAFRRKNNGRIWNMLLQNHEGIEILKPFQENITPQTFPIVIKQYDRNKLYFELNKAGYGAVSLYHTMIEPIKTENLKDAIWLSEHIINMPVHQDVGEEEIKQMSEKLLEIIGD